MYLCFSNACFIAFIFTKCKHMFRVITIKLNKAILKCMGLDLSNYFNFINKTQFFFALKCSNPDDTKLLN